MTYGNTNANGKAYIAQITCDTGFAFKQEEYNGNSTLYAVCNEDGVWDWGSPSYTRFPECQGKSWRHCWKKKECMHFAVITLNMSFVIIQRYIVSA